MNKEELLKLREQIVGKTRQMALNDTDTDPASRLEVLMGLIRSGDVSRDVMHKANEVAEQLPDGSARLGAFLDLIFEIDAKLGDTNLLQDQVDMPENDTDRTDGVEG